MKLICISTIEWCELWQRHQEFMAALASRGWTVYYVENMGFRPLKLSDFRRILRRLFQKLISCRNLHPGPRKVPSNIHIVSPIVLPPSGSLFRWINDKWFIPKLVSKLRRMGLDAVDVAFVYLPAWSTIDLLSRLGCRTIIYDCVANFAEHPDKPADFEQIERELLKIASVVATDSDFLYEYMGTKHSRVIQLHHGVNIEVFERSMARPLPKTYKTIGFFGTIDSRMDWDAVEALTKAGANVQLIGRVKTNVPAGINVVGPLVQEELADYLERCDALMIPYRLSGFSNGIIPAKLFECLATGKPVLVSPLPYVQKYRSVVYVCESPSDYENYWLKLHETETQSIREARWSVANRHRSTQNYEKLEGVIRIASEAARD